MVAVLPWGKQPKVRRGLSDGETFSKGDFSATGASAATTQLGAEVRRFEDENPSIAGTETTRLQPSWMSRAVEQLAALGYLQPNWNGYGSPSPALPTRLTALRVLGLVMQPATPAPHIGAGFAGEVVMTWHERGMEIEVEITSADEWSMSMHDLRGPASADLDADIRQNVAPLAEAVNRLTQRTAS